MTWTRKESKEEQEWMPSFLRSLASPLHTPESAYYTSYSSIRASHSDSVGDKYCLIQFRLKDWHDCLLIALCAMAWNLPIIVWMCPWRHRYPSLASVMQALFRSRQYGVSLQHWKQLGKYTGVLMQRLVDKHDYHAYVTVLIALTVCSFVGKVLLFLSLKLAVYDEMYESLSLAHFVNGQTILLSLMFVSDWFFLLAVCRCVPQQAMNL